MEFCRDTRPHLNASGHQLSITEVGKELGKMWRELSPERKAFYELKAKENMIKYNAEKKLRMESSVGPQQDLTALDSISDVAAESTTSNVSSEDVALSTASNTVCDISERERFADRGASE